MDTAYTIQGGQHNELANAVGRSLGLSKESRLYAPLSDSFSGILEGGGLRGSLGSPGLQRTVDCEWFDVIAKNKYEVSYVYLYGVRSIPCLGSYWVGGLANQRPKRRVRVDLHRTKIHASLVDNSLGYLLPQQSSQ